MYIFLDAPEIERKGDGVLLPGGGPVIISVKIAEKWRGNLGKSMVNNVNRNPHRVAYSRKILYK